VQQRTSHAQSSAIGKIGSHGGIFLQKRDTSKFSTFSHVKGHAKAAQCRQRFWQHALAARLLNGRRTTICYDYAQIFLSSGYSGCQTRRATADYQYVRLLLVA
jgi:hypothetical protein